MLESFDFEVYLGRAVTRAAATRADVLTSSTSSTSSTFRKPCGLRFDAGLLLDMTGQIEIGSTIVVGGAPPTPPLVAFGKPFQRRACNARSPRQRSGCCSISAIFLSLRKKTYENTSSRKSWNLPRTCGLNATYHLVRR